MAMSTSMTDIVTAIGSLEAGKNITFIVSKETLIDGLDALDALMRGTSDAGIDYSVSVIKLLKTDDVTSFNPNRDSYEVTEGTEYFAIMASKPAA